MTDPKDNSDPTSPSAVLAETLPPTKRVFPNVRATTEYEQLVVTDAYNKAFVLMKNTTVGRNKRKILRDVADKLVDITGYGGLPPFEKVRDQFKPHRQYDADGSIDLALKLLKDHLDWSGDKYVLHKAQGSRVHVLQQALVDSLVIVLGKDPATDRPKAFSVDSQREFQDFGHIFLVEHDWAAAFANAEDISEDTEIKLPYEYMTFEFHVNNRRVIVLARETDQKPPIEMLVAAETPFGWFMLSQLQHTGIEVYGPLLNELYSHIKAILISLDAEVTISEVIRAPHKLNHAREKAGKLPIADHHVIRLAHRSRVPRLEDPSGEPGTKKRLHFRRGHWRHYQDHKTWIRWMLVGDPDLGFIDKTYRL